MSLWFARDGAWRRMRHVWLQSPLWKSTGSMRLSRPLPRGTFRSQSRSCGRAASAHFCLHTKSQRGLVGPVGPLAVGMQRQAQSSVMPRLPRKGPFGHAPIMPPSPKQFRTTRSGHQQHMTSPTRRDLSA